MKKKFFKFINNEYFEKFIYILIVLNVLIIILESFQELNIKYFNFFHYFEVFSVIVFTIEYAVRFWTSNIEEKNGRIKFFTSSMGIIDLIAILPFYLPFIFPFDLRILRILRLFRLLRIFKLGRYSKSMRTIICVLKETKAELILSCFVALVLLIISSTLMYYIENEAQPEKFSSIVHSFYWAVATLTTVGYGDVYPVTMLGKILSAFIALIGIGFVALPTGILSSAFIEKLQEDRKAKEHEMTCPKCQEKIRVEKN